MLALLIFIFLIFFTKYFHKNKIYSTTFYMISVSFILALIYRGNFINYTLTIYKEFELLRFLKRMDVSKPTSILLTSYLFLLQTFNNFNQYSGLFPF